MKTIGLIGGMSWESTATYYRLINEGVRDALGGLHSAQIVLNSVDFAEIQGLQQTGDWEATARILTKAARSVETAGADFVLLCTNTMHKVAPQLEAALSVPLLHLADATADRLTGQGVQCVGLLGTRFTMEQNFYRERLEARGIQVMVPTADERDRVHRVIFEELCLGQIRTESRSAYLEIISALSERGAQGVILGCTEIGLLISAADTPVPLYDTTQIHAEQAIKRALAD